MENKLTYTFDDVPVSKFFYDLDNKRIEVHFNGYSDLIKNMCIQRPCVWTIENWEYAKSKVGGEPKRYDLEEHIGIFSLILFMKYNDDNELEMHINTVDERFPILYFKNPELSLKEENPV